MQSKKRASNPIEISQLLLKDPQNQDLSGILVEVEKRKKLQVALYEALDEVGFGQFAPEITIGEMNEAGEIRLLTKHATIVSKLKNKLPSILNYLRHSGFQIKVVHLKVTPNSLKLDPQESSSNSKGKKALEKRPLSPAAKNALQDLLINLEHDSKLRDSVIKLIRLGV